MTSFVVERAYPDGKGGVTRHKIVVPVVQASDDEFGAYFATQLREFLFRHGVNVSHVTDDILCMQTRATFAARGGVLPATSIESGV